MLRKANVTVELVLASTGCDDGVMNGYDVGGDVCCDDGVMLEALTDKKYKVKRGGYCVTFVVVLWQFCEKIRGWLPLDKQQLFKMQLAFRLNEQRRMLWKTSVRG